MSALDIFFFCSSKPSLCSLKADLEPVMSLQRLLNQLVPNSIPQIDKRDLNSAKKSNIVAFVNAARLLLPLQPHEFFDPDNLVSPFYILRRWTYDWDCS